MNQLRENEPKEGKNKIHLKERTIIFLFYLYLFFYFINVTVWETRIDLSYFIFIPLFFITCLAKPKIHERELKSIEEYSLILFALLFFQATFLSIFYQSMIFTRGLFSFTAIFLLIIRVKRIGVAQYIFPKAYLLPFAIPLISFVISLYQGNLYRLSGTLQDPNYASLALIIFLSFYLSRNAYRKNLFFSGLVLLFVCFFIITTVSRSGIISLILFLSIIFVSPSIKTITKKRGIILVLVFVIVIPLVLNKNDTLKRIINNYTSLVAQRFQPSIETGDYAGALSRIKQIEQGVHLISQNPYFLLWGSGMGSTSNKTIKKEIKWDLDSQIHNSFVAIIVENGLFILILLFGFFWKIIAYNLNLRKDCPFEKRVYKGTILAIIFSSLFIYNLTYLPALLGLTQGFSSPKE